MAGAVAVQWHRQKLMEQREARKQFMEDQLRMNRYFKKYDKTHEGTLNKDELRTLLRDLNDGKDVSEDEFQWVMETADKSRTGDLSFGELKIAVCTFKSYQRSKPFIDSVMLKYDEHKTGRLEFGDLKKMLTDISGGAAPSDEAVADVLERFGTKAKLKLASAPEGGGTETSADSQEDGIPTTQTVHAITYWYTHPKAVQEDEEGVERAASSKNQVATAGKNGSVCGGCCMS
jgi:Ca2+-binding EF-hand superfamily protein